ncbi:hypothetical protein [Clostridium tarantellae]|uniref:hypothetical protein n=1 Tax=Clostridium tarantellae TaxID=39493 RepID=UPI00147809C5|nr:hypothetical protein [Clostridium tarantellae]
MKRKKKELGTLAKIIVAVSFSIIGLPLTEIFFPLGISIVILGFYFASKKY